MEDVWSWSFAKRTDFYEGFVLIVRAKSEKVLVYVVLDIGIPFLQSR